MVDDGTVVAYTNTLFDLHKFESPVPVMKP